MTHEPLEDGQRRFALLTKSYLPDLERCELLVDSVQRCAPDLTHYLVVDRIDYPAFRHLGDRAEIILSEDLLPFGAHRTSRRAYWLTRHAWPTRGWIMQQILKIAAARQLESDYFICCDSDVAFVRPFSPSRLMANGDVGLLDVAFVNDDVRSWTQFAAGALGVDRAHLDVRGHVGELVCWSQEHIVGMTERMQSVTGSHWYRPLLRARSFSEYILYGVYVREILGYPAASHFPSTDPLCLGLWERNLTDQRLETFFAEQVQAENIAVMVYSKGGVDPQRYRSLVERCWESNI